MFIYCVRYTRDHNTIATCKQYGVIFSWFRPGNFNQSFIVCFGMIFYIALTNGKWRALWKVEMVLAFLYRFRTLHKR